MLRDFDAFVFLQKMSRTLNDDFGLLRLPCEVPDGTREDNTGEDHGGYCETAETAQARDPSRQEHGARTLGP